MAGFVTPITEWTIRGVVVVSLCAHLVLALFASVRRRQRSGVRTAVLWSAYQVADWAAPFVLSNLSLGSTPAEHQLVAFWLPFLLAHLGGPDNIAAYSFDDNKISLRQAISTFLRFQGVVLANKGALFWASAAMVAVGVAKYVERVRALRSGDFGNMRSSARDEHQAVRPSIQSHRRRGGGLDDEQALFVAHQLLQITKGAFADYSAKEQAFEDDGNNNLGEMFSYEGGWENMCKVVQMELSLIHPLHQGSHDPHLGGYLIRIVSPVATGTMMVLFWFYRKDGQRRADVAITYILLMVSFLLDVRWLLGAIASTWAYAFFDARPACWLRHEIFCSGRWHRLRRAMVSLDPGRQLIFRGPGSYRLWSGTMGQYNLFEECTRDTTSLCRKLVTWVASEDTWIELKYSTHCKLVLPGARAPKEADERGARRYLLDKALGFVPEFQELVLILHVATDVFLITMSKRWQFSHTEEVCKEAIQAMSDYMTFLAAARPDMLPGLNFRSLYNETREALRKIWRNEPRGSSSKHSLACTLQRMEKNRRPWIIRNKILGSKSELQDKSFILSEGIVIADVLLAMLSSPYSDTDITELLGVDPNGKDDGLDWKDGDIKWRQRIFFLIKLLIPGLGRNGTKGSYQMEQLLKLILECWVRMLINVSTRCSGDSHARQLGRGCELTTIVWILGEHASIFGVSKT
ncbi:LOW QUALITY PROTEIN: hypothetical protein U9M48_016011 [Paspalum notatum var. saurae]|uniref:DUF4220 domain-containing protein n=1 Tax=Paspalum notatum var. saurae TaxID=547442 RepID=A0AAQ3T664_PASNO